MCRDEVIVTVLKPEGGYHVFNVPHGHVAEVRATGTAVLLDKTDDQQPASGLPDRLRLECDCGADRCTMCEAAEVIERLQVLELAASAYESGLMHTGDTLWERAQRMGKEANRG